MIEVSGLTKQYGNFTAVKNLSFHVGRGEIVGFLGVNGAGKTTTLRMLAGILAPTSGSASIGGYSIESAPRDAKRITGFVPDRPHLYGRLTAREYLEFICDLYDVPRKTQAQKIDALLNEYRLSDWGNELVESFSHGMKQRLATCGALVHDPKVLVVDEPMVGLDPHGAKLLKEALKRNAAAGMSILLSTHSLNVAEEVAHRIMIINRGELIASGSVAEIKALAAGGNLEQVFLELTQNAESL